MNNFRAFISASRLRTLPAGAVPVIVGSALARHDGGFAFFPALAALLGAVLIQVGTNLVNDADDFERGADDDRRVGPTRAVQSGALSAGDVRRAAYMCFGAAALVGLYLVAHSGWPILLVGMASIAAGLAYTGGPWPLGYHGLGDVFVFLFFGLAAVCGTYFVQTGSVTGGALLCGATIGALATAILVVNNVRDAATDVDAGKRTLAVRFGDAFGRAEYRTLVAAAYVAPLLGWLVGALPFAAVLAYLSLPAAIRLVRAMDSGTSGGALNPILGETAKLELIYGLLLSGALLF